MTRPARIVEATVLRRARPIAFTELDADHLAIDAEAGALWALNSVGVRVWELLEEPLALASILERLRAEFDVDRETCRRDVTELVEELVRQGLVSPVDE